MVVVGLYAAGEFSAPIGKTFATEQECAEHFSSHGMRVGMAAAGKIKRLAQGRTIVSVTVGCRRT